MEEHRRSHRYADFLPITITINRDSSLARVAGPLSARIIDVSNHGACLLLTQVVVQSYHIFHSMKDNESLVLGLTINLPQESAAIQIMAKPVWLNSSTLDDIKVFKMGVDFTSSIDDDLMHSINKFNTRK